MNNLSTVRAYLAKLPPAISGQGGHPATFRAACECVRFGLSDGNALRLLGEWNVTHCQPPWTEKELAHKLADAHRRAAGQVRAVRQYKPAVRVVWKIERKTPAEPMKPTPAPTPATPAPEPARLWPIRPGLPLHDEFADVADTWTRCNCALCLAYPQADAQPLTPQPDANLLPGERAALALIATLEL